MEHLAPRLAAIPGVVAVTLGGSRARGDARPGADWDFGLYYRDGIDVDAVRALGFDGEVFEPGAWGRIPNGGAWLTVDGERVDLIYRDLAYVEHWMREADAGRFEVYREVGYVAGVATYTLAGELALNKVLSGSLPRPSSFPAALRDSAPRWWHNIARGALRFARSHAVRGDAIGVTGNLAVAVLATANARCAERGEWAINEKGLGARAGLDDVSLSSIDEVEAALATATR